MQAVGSSRSPIFKTSTTPGRHFHDPLYGDPTPAADQLSKTAGYQRRLEAWENRQKVKEAEVGEY